MVKPKDPYKEEKSPYWSTDNVEKSKRIIENLPNLSSSERNLLFKNILDARIKVKGKDTIGNIETTENLESELDKSTEVRRKAKPYKVKDPENRRKITKCFRTRIYKIRMTKRTSSTLRKWIDDVRYVYNKVVTYLKGRSDKINIPEMRDIRDFFTVEEGNVEQTDPIIRRSFKRTPQKVRAEACFEAVRAHNLSLIKKFSRNPEHKALCKDLVRIRRELDSVILSLEIRKNKKSRLQRRKVEFEAKIEALEKLLEEIPRTIEKKSNVKFRLKKSPYATMTMPKTSARSLEDKHVRIYPSYDDVDPIRVNGLKELPNHNFELRWHRRTNSWHMHVPEQIRVISQSERSTHKTCMIDPGVRDPLTCVDFVETGEPKVFVLGENWFDETKIARRVERIRKFARMNVTKESLASYTLKEQQRLLMLKRTVELDRKKILNIVKDFQKKNARFLLDKYDIIGLPLLKLASIVKKGGNIDKKTKHKAALLSHGYFFHFLRWKALTMGKVVINQDESYTTKTCYTCGFLTDIGGDKTYKCGNKQCGNDCDRDAQSCLNITTRYMSDYQSLQ